MISREKLNHFRQGGIELSTGTSSQTFYRTSFIKCLSQTHTHPSEHDSCTSTAKTDNQAVQRNELVRRVRLFATTRKCQQKLDFFSSPAWRTFLNWEDGNLATVHSSLIKNSTKWTWAKSTCLGTQEEMQNDPLSRDIISGLSSVSIPALCGEQCLLKRPTCLSMCF
jgi:hypothetical protein